MGNMTKKIIEVKANDTIDVKGFYKRSASGLQKTFYFYSVASYALDYNECPIEAYERCLQNQIDFPYNGHKTHWASPKTVMLSSTPVERQKPVAVDVEFGDCVKFEGRWFQLGEDHNDNLSLTEVTQDEATAIMKAVREKASQEFLDAYEAAVKELTNEEVS